MTEARKQIIRALAGAGGVTGIPLGYLTFEEVAEFISGAFGPAENIDRLFVLYGENQSADEYADTHSLAPESVRASRRRFAVLSAFRSAIASNPPWLHVFYEENRQIRRLHTDLVRRFWVPAIEKLRTISAFEGLAGPLEPPLGEPPILFMSAQVDSFIKHMNRDLWEHPPIGTSIGPALYIARRFVAQHDGQRVTWEMVRAELAQHDIVLGPRPWDHLKGALKAHHPDRFKAGRPRKKTPTLKK